MGIGLVKEALLPAHAGLSPFARLVLVTMASTAYDATVRDTPGRLYWGGHGLLGVMLLGVGEGEPGWPSAQRRITRAISELTTAGALEVEHPAAAGSRAVYRLTTSQLRLVDNSPSAGRSGAS